MIEYTLAMDQAQGERTDALAPVNLGRSASRKIRKSPWSCSS